jgi:N,N'-diacetyllegionaminate synthase
MNTFIIAEAGVNHNGSIKRALDLVRIAADSGADSVKFQTFIAEEEISKNAPKAQYQKKTTDSTESQLEMVKKLELNENDHLKIIELSDENNIEFMSSAFDLISIELLESFDLNRIKIPSGEITNVPYLRQIGGTGKPIIMSTGMSTLDEVRDALNILLEAGAKKDKITILHCNTEYPTPMEDVNLRAMLTIRDELGVNVGYSDHTLGIEIPIAAVAMGATVIEKHFTLDRTLPGPDHAASLEPDELKLMVQAIRNIEKAMGDGIKKPSPSEIKNMPIARKSIVAKNSIKKGEKFSKKNLTVKRPGSGVSPMEWDNVIGKVANHDYEMDDLIR